MPPNPQICLLHSANFIVLTPWFQGASKGKTSMSHLLSSARSQAPAHASTPTTAIPLRCQHPEKELVCHVPQVEIHSGCSNERVLGQISHAPMCPCSRPTFGQVSV